MPLVQDLPKILIVDDNHNNLDVLSDTLISKGFHVSVAIDGENALDQIEYYQPELILLDAMMPNIDGFETCQLLKQNPVTCNIPIIFMTALGETDVKVRAFKLGASDFITKPFESAELLARVELQLKLSNFQETLKQQNHQLQYEINQRYEVEVALLEINDQLTKSNNVLKAEIENRELIEKKLQVEILERKQAEKAVKKSLMEKELLLKEIHHRVKNNLFIVSSLLEFQSNYIDDPQIIKMLSNSQNRIMSMALIHEQLHSKTDLSQIDFQQYVTNLTDNLIDSYFTTEINLTVDVAQVCLNIETANSCGLIINELISNSLEHAFSENTEGNIKLDFIEDDSGNLTLIVKDDGIGFSDVNIFYESESLGIKLILTLVEQLEGKLEVKSDYSSAYSKDRGTEVKITFRELDYQNRV